MKKKFGIKTRIFLGFGFFVIALINLILYILYLGFEKAYISGLKEKISENYKIITKIIDQKNGNITNLSEKEIEEIKSLGFFIYFGKNNEKIEKNYKLGYFIYDKDLIFRGDYKGKNILIGKNISDFLSLKSKILELIILADIIGVFLIIMMVYFITNKLLKPLLELSKKISNYDITKDKDEIKNNFGESEIGLITKSINKLICKSKNILESQRRFIQDSNHELKTPLMQIDSNLEIIEEKIEDEKILKKIESIKESTTNINKIISNLGFILREENIFGKKEKINIFFYLENFVKSFKQDAENKNIEIILKNFEILEIENDTYFLDRLFGNLLQNSIFYNNGNSKIIFEIYKNKVILKDEGIGISSQELEKIFDRFYRNENSNIYNNKGNGLGLTIVKKICDDFGWRLNIKSEVGKGSDFEIIFKE